MADASENLTIDSRTARLLDVVRQLAAPCDLPELLASVIDAGREVLQADRGTVFLYDPGPRELFITVATGLSELRFSIDKGIAGQCARNRAIINVPDCYRDPRFNQEVDRKTGYRTQCLIAVPLIGFDDQLVGVLQLLNADKGRFDEDDERIATALAAQAAVAIQRARLMEERIVKLKMEHDIRLAREIQQNVLPQSMPRCPGYDLAAFNRPADETGGDIFDVLPLPTRESDPAAPLLMMLADATGHGIGPALSVTQARAMFRIGLRLNCNLIDLINHIDLQLCEDLQSSRFITAFFGRLDPCKHRIDYEAPGQGPLLHFHADTGECEYRGATNVPLGIMAGTPSDPHEPFLLQPGDMFVLLTDGFYEAVDPAGIEFGQDRVSEIVRDHAHRSAEQIIAALIEQLDTYRAGGPQLDDLTALLIKRTTP